MIYKKDNYMTDQQKIAIQKYTLYLIQFVHLKIYCALGISKQFLF